MIPPTPANDDLHGAIAVIDTCVLLDITSCHSVVEAWNGGSPTAKLGYRCARARDSLVLATTLHRAKARTYSLASEPLDKLVDFAPPTVNGLPTAFTRVAHLYVLEAILSDWSIVGPDQDGLPEPRSNAADRELTRVAAEYKLPLVTLDAKLGKKAARQGVSVMSPGDYLAAASVDVAGELAYFSEKYLERIPTFSATQPDPPKVERFLRWLFGFYQGVFAHASP